MSSIDEELYQLLDKAVTHLENYRLTFTDEEALQDVWDHGYDISPQSDPRSRFVLAYEADGQHPRQWRLHTQTLANNRLLDALNAGSWHGRNLEAELSRLDAEDQSHYIFCPCDPRFTRSADGIWEPANHEHNIELTPTTRAELDAFAPLLLQEWQRQGSDPWTVLQVTDQLGALGWPGASERNGWLLVRAWLLEWSQVLRVGQDYWLPLTHIPQVPARARLQVSSVVSSLPQSEPSDTPDTQILTTAGSTSPAVSARTPSLTLDSSQQPIHNKAVISPQLSWTQPLRTIHQLEGFLPVPSAAHSAYPPRAPGQGDREVLRGLWFDDDEQLWLWLDRTHDRLYGPNLANKLAWLDAGDLLRITWRPEVIVLQLADHDDEIQCEETRLLDLDALKTLRGGLGETYRQSIQAILSEKPDGLPFAQIVTALRDRQGHSVHRGTVRALLYTGGFQHNNALWFASPHPQLAAHNLRAALLETLAHPESTEAAQQAEEITHSQRLSKRVKAIRTRLSELRISLSENSQIDH